MAIKFVIGQSDSELAYSENVWIYIRKHKRYINLVRRELTAIEQELSGGRSKTAQSPDTEKPVSEKNDSSLLDEDAIHLDESTLMELLKTHPNLAMEIIKRGL